MYPIEFPEQNLVLAEDQPEYLPLPSHRADDGEVISCWLLSWRERLRVLWTGRLWLRQLTFNEPLQPQLLEVESPFHGE